ncbi:NAD(P)-binding protein [Ascobolus immersus RN42]|uniref:NAD(P)-binding protein n=1 Tax=Ascobolus immersus RN42 TaxID=1160509 RepID=A0A3N4HXM1_ASCIM|nr:NAD(P)-binding protein [Ascobolus immersus RN42]
MTRTFPFTSTLAHGDGIPDLTGKVAIVTGSNGGIGIETAYYLASHNCTVYIASRESQKTTAAHSTLLERLLKAKVPNAEKLLHILPLSLNSIAAANDAARHFLSLNTGRLDILINNAGIAFEVGDKLSQDGFEIQFQVNFLSHLAFTLPLLPLLQKTSVEHGSARLVNVGSDAHRLFVTPPEGGKELFGMEEIRTAAKPANGNSWGVGDIGGSGKRYGLSKLAVLMVTTHLSDLLEQEYPNLRIITTHPGTIATTGLGGGMGQFGIPSWVLGITQWLASVFYGGLSEEDGALSATWAACAEVVEKEGIRAGYWVPVQRWYGGAVRAIGEGEVNALSHDKETGKKLYDWAVEYIQRYTTEAA